MNVARDDYQVVILAGGKGSRLKDLTDFCPKCLLPIANKPMIHYPLTMALQAGFSEIIIVTSDMAMRPLKDYLWAEDRSGLQADQLSRVRLVEVNSEKDYGTLEVLLSHPELSEILCRDVIVLSCDTLSDVNLQQLANVCRSAKSDQPAPLVCALGKSHVKLSEVPVIGRKMKKRKNFTDIIGMKDDSTVCVYVPIEDVGDCVSVPLAVGGDPGACIQFFTQHIDPHVYILPQNLIQQVRRDSNLMDNLTRIQSELLPYLAKEAISRDAKKQFKDAIGSNDVDANSTADRLADGIRAVMLSSQNMCWRANNISNYFEANRLMLSRTPRLTREKSLLSASSTVGSATTVEKSVVGADCRIGEACRLLGCVLFTNVTIGNNCMLTNCILADHSEVEDGCDLKNVIIGASEKACSLNKLSNDVIRRSISIEI